MPGPPVPGTYSVQLLSQHTNQNGELQPQQSPILALVTVHTLQTNPADGICILHASDFGLAQFGSVTCLAAYGFALSPDEATIVIGRVAFEAVGGLVPIDDSDGQQCDISFLYPESTGLPDFTIATELDTDGAQAILLIT